MSKDVVATLVLPDDRDAASAGPPPARAGRRRLLAGGAVVAGLVLAGALLRPGGDPTPPDRDSAELQGRPAVAVVGENVELGPSGSFDVDLVNIGNQSVLVVGRLGSLAGRIRILGDPALPIDLAPDERQRVRLTLVLTACPSPGPAGINEQLGLEARSSVGWAFAQGTPGSELGRAFSAAATAAGQAQCGQ
jgi:hypothetical protein